MISEPNPPPDGRTSTWAAEQLGVPPESAPEVCTTAFLRRLAEEDFVPPPRLRQAWEFAARGSSEGRPTLPWLDSAAEEDLRGRVEEFAGQFFNLPPEQRSALWERLYADARRWPRLETRLRQLKPGLTVEFAPLPALGVREAKLIQWIRELFPLPLDERAQRRREMLRDEVGNDIRPWQKAARRVRRRQRVMASLAPDLLVPLATWSHNVKAASRNRLSRGVDGVRPRPAAKYVQTASIRVRWFAIALGLAVLIAVFQDRPWQQPRSNQSVNSTPFYQPPQIDPETLKRLEDLQMINGQVDAPPSNPPEPNDSKIREMFEELERKDGRIANPPDQSPLSPAPSNTPPDHTSLPPASVPASPAGPNR